MSFLRKMSFCDNLRFVNFKWMSGFFSYVGLIKKGGTLADDLIDGAKHMAGKGISTQTGNLMSNANDQEKNDDDYTGPLFEMTNTTSMGVVCYDINGCSMLWHKKRLLVILQI